MKVTFTKEELESIIVEHNDKEDDINLHISTTDDIAKAILLEIYVSTPTLDFEVQSVSWDYLEWDEGEKE
jgi:hypothetical protein